jgi:hypothetical protein
MLPIGAEHPHYIVVEGWFKGGLRVGHRDVESSQCQDLCKYQSISMAEKMILRFFVTAVTPTKSCTRTEGGYTRVDTPTQMGDATHGASAASRQPEFQLP